MHGRIVQPREGSHSAKRWLALISAVLMYGPVACGGTNLGKSTATLQIEPTVDFGTIPIGRRQEALLHLRNAGRVAVHITSCGFVAPAPEDFTVSPGEQKVLNGGETLPITVSFGPLALGQRAVSLVINTDSPTAPTLNVMLSGTGVLGKADLAQNGLDFGAVAINTSATLALDFSNQTDTDAQVMVPAATGDDADAFRPGTTGWSTVSAHGSLSIPVSFVPSRVGPHSGHLLVQLCPSCQAQDVPLTGEGVAATVTADPTKLDFGPVLPGSTRTLPVTIANVGSEPVQLLSLTFGDSSGSVFSAQPFPAGGVALNVNASQAIQVTFAPQTLEHFTGTLRIQTTAESAPVIVIPLSGYGGGPQIQVLPNAVAFAQTSVDVPEQQTVTIGNTGTGPGSALTITALSLQGDEFSYSLMSGRALPVTIQPGQTLPVTLTYLPTQAHSSTGTLTISSADLTGNPLNDVQVPLTGSAGVLGPCSFTVSPPQLSFGSVATGQQLQLAVMVQNTGTNACAVANVRTSLATPPEFAIPAMNASLIQPGASLAIPVEFMPDQQASFQGAMLFDISSDTTPEVSVPLSGDGVDPCLAVAPTSLQFGDVGLTCQPPTKQVLVQNTCNLAVTVQSSSISGSSAYSTPALANAITLQPGQQLQVAVTYTPKVAEHDLGTLAIQTFLATQPYFVLLDGTAQTDPTQTDTFQLSPVNKVDFLIVMDNSGSMQDKQTNVATNASALLQGLASANLDFHIAITTTGLYPYTAGWAQCPGGANGGEDGRFFPVDNSRPRIMTNTTPDLSGVFAQNIQVGVCHWWEEGLEAARLALSSPLIDHADDPNTPDPNDGNLGFLRDDAKLYVFYISDANDSDTTPVEMYIDQLRNLKPGHPEMVGVSAAIGLPTCNHIESVGTRYEQVVQAFGGIVADICTSNWGSLLAQVAQQAASPGASVFPLSKPAQSNDITVTVGGVPVAPKDANGNMQWHFDSTIGVNGAVVFSPGNIPTTNQTVQITYSVACS